MTDRLDRRWPLYEFLSTFAWDQYYFPMDGAFQNYSYFPPMSLREIRACWEKTTSLMRAGRAPQEIGVYVHWPFCPSRCTYCYCSMRVPSGRGEMEEYLGLLEREIDALKGAFSGVRFGSVWLGGGTPTFMAEGQLDRLLGRLRDSFELESGAQVYVEASPATLTAGKMEVLLRRGVNRMTLGVQSLDEGVLKRIDRAGQTRQSVERAWSLMAGRPGLLTDMDLIFGLEGQSAASFVRDLGWAVKKGPDAIHVYGFDPRPQTAYAQAGGGLEPTRREELRRTAAAADRVLSACGYRTARTDPERGADAPEERQDGSVRRLGASVLGLGDSAISHAFGAAWYCHALAPASARRRTRDGVLAFQGMRSGLDEEKRGWALRQLSLLRRLPRAPFRTLFGEDPLESREIAPALRDFAARGILRVESDALAWSGGDEVESLIALKHLYSPAVVRALLKGRAAAWRDFRRAPPERAGRWPDAAARKMTDRGTFRVYFKAPRPLPEPARASPTDAEETLRRGFLSRIVRSDDYPPKVGLFNSYAYFPPMGLGEIRSCWEKTTGLMREGRAPKEIGVYVHWPFCPSRCTYCYCSMRVPSGRGEMEEYLDLLEREIDALKGAFTGVRFGSVWLGGGTPTFMSEGQLDRLLGRLRDSFELEAGAQVYAEASPATLTAGKMGVLLRRGVNRMTLGVQSLDEGVLKRIDRAGQTRQSVERAWSLMAGRPGLLTDMDLIFGLEGQSAASFVRDLGWAVKKGPDAIHVYGFDPRPQTAYAQAGGGLEPTRREELRRTAAAADRVLSACGYRTARTDPERGADAPEERQDGELRRLGASVLGLGAAAKSHAFGAAWYEHRPSADGRVDADGLLPFYALKTSPEEEERGFAIRHLNRFGAVSRTFFRARFGRDVLETPAVGPALERLAAEGALRIAPETIAWEPGDPVDHALALKGLYGEDVASALRALQESEQPEFERNWASDPALARRALREGIEANTRYMVYYRGASRRGEHALS